jgi:ABC-type lipoprotein release transport system permease subunit
MFGGEAAAPGRYFKLSKGSRVLVVGVVEDGKYTSLTEAPKPAMFFPITQSPNSETWLVVRAQRDSTQLARTIRARMHELDPGLPVFLQTWEGDLQGALFPSRVATVALGIMGILGAMLAVTGIFGMAAYSVSKRLRELGIRMALGARRKQVLEAGLGRALKLLACGSIVGIGLGLLSTQVLSAIVYEADATPRDPVVLAEVLLTMLALGLLATWIPAHRALSLDPIRLLREE